MWEAQERMVLMDKKARVEELVELLNKYSYEYNKNIYFDRI